MAASNAGSLTDLDVNPRQRLGLDDDAWAEHGYSGGRIEPGERPAILVIDFQGPSDPEQLPLIDRARENAGRLLRSARSLGVPVYQTAVLYLDERYLGMWRYKARDFLLACSPDSAMGAIDDRVWDPSDIMLPKLWGSFFHGTPLISLLVASQRDTLILVGQNTSGCVRATANDAFAYGFRTLVAEDCVGDVALDAHDQNLTDLHRRYADIVSSQEALEYLERVASK